MGVLVLRGGIWAEWLTWEVRRLRLLPCLFFCVLLASCAGKPENIIGVDSLANPAASVAGATRHTIYIATTREVADDPAVLYSSKRKPLSLNFARVDVYVPPNHKPGHVERPGSVPPNPEKDFVILRPETFANAQGFQRSVDQHLAERPRDDQEIMLFVHGFNNDLVDSVLKIAQIKHDSGFKGIPVLFSWASHGKALSYVYDLNSTLHARDGLISAAVALTKTRTTGLSVIAHSMGNFLTVEAMRQAQLLGKFNSSGKLNNVILASPDIDVEVFKKQMQVFPKSDRRFYVLISDDDKALALSRRLAGGVNRVGDDDAQDLADLGVTVLDLSNIKDTSSLDHGKFADSPEIVQLIGNRMNSGDTIGKKHKMFSRVPAAASLLTGAAGAVVVFN